MVTASPSLLCRSNLVGRRQLTMWPGGVAGVCACACRPFGSWLVEPCAVLLHIRQCAYHTFVLTAKP